MTAWRRRPEPEPARAVRTDVHRIAVSTAGMLDTVRPVMSQRRPPGSGEIEVRVQAGGINFIDVLKAMGMYPGLTTTSETALGAECAGVVVAVGNDVTDFAIGDQVVAITPSYDSIALLASFVTIPAGFAVRRPQRIGVVDAAALPVAMLTAWYALHELGRLRRGDRVLVHAATGGVGLAAVEICRRTGAEVIATAGSDEKRAWLRARGIEHVFDSRRLDFTEEVMVCTGGRGVDLVVNSLSGKAIAAGLAVLAPRGRFLEIGKADIYADSAIGLLPFKNNLSFFAIDLARLTVEEPAYVGQMFRHVMSLVDAGELGVLPTTAAPAAESSEAFREMAQARHIGKLVLTYPDQPLVVDAGMIRPDSTYLITGGTGGLGIAVAERLVARGARYIVLLGRNVPSEAASAAIARLVDGGARVMPMAADVSRFDDLGSALDQVRAEMPPLRGIVHAAGVLADATLGALDADRLRAALAPKVDGGWNLHLLTEHEDLDFFVLFSSVSALFGLAGQANYAAANAFLDALAHHRRRMGKVATSIDWGPWAVIGLAAADDDRGSRLEELGLGGLAPNIALDAFEALLTSNAVQAAVMRLDVARWIDHDPSSRALLGKLLGDGPVTESRVPAQLGRALAEAVSGRRRRALLEETVCRNLASVLRTPVDRIDRRRSLKAMGLDSLMALELRNRLEADTGLTLSATISWNYPNVVLLSEFLGARMGVSFDDLLDAAHDEEVFDGPGSPDDLSSEHLATDLSADDLDILLRDELAAIDRLLQAD